MPAKIKWNNWRDRLKDASFRGVAFHVQSTTREGGRRSALHEFPFSDEPYWEDMGAAAATYQIVGYVIANTENSFDYFRDRDRLIAALSKAGPGQLVHPFYGIRNVGLKSNFKLDESFAEGGVARFTMVFVDAGRAAQPAGLPDPASLADTECNAATAVSKAQMASNIATTGPGLFAQAAALYARVADAVAAVQNTLLTVQSTIVAVISDVQTSVAALAAGIQAIINFPAQLSAAIHGILAVYDNLIPHMPKKNTSNVDAALALTTFGDNYAEIIPTTGSQEQELKNRNSLVDTMRCGGLIAAVRAAAYAEYGSAEDAIAMMNKLIAAIDGVLDNIGANSQNDLLYDAMRGLKSVVTSTMIAKGANLPSTKMIMLPGDPQPSLVLAQSLYGDIIREQEIIDMNPLTTRHPGFPSAGSELRVLSE